MQQEVNPLDPILEPEGRGLLLGNEAIARGCIEAGVGVATTYPGTPSSEIGEVLERVAHEVGMYFEYSTNEKVAMEVAGAAAASGIRSFAFMKHVGLNVASDAIMTLAYTGVRAGMVVLSADDPSSHSSQNEQDNRYYSKLAVLPMLEPSTPREAKEMLVQAFKVSEYLQVPVLFRTTTRVNHARGVVPLGTLPTIRRQGHFEKDARRFVTIPAHARLDRISQLEREKKAKELSERSPLNITVGMGKVGVITSGVSYTYVSEWVTDAEILKLGFTNPLPDKKIARFLSSKRHAMVVEELEPFLEDQVLRIGKEAGLDLPIYGKRSGHLPRAYEYTPDVLSRLGDLLRLRKGPIPLAKGNVAVPGRPPTLCAGCPHRGTFHAVKRAVGRQEVVYSTDIGCYTLGTMPPLEIGDFVLCMGSSIGAAGGFSKATDQKVIALIGDSTFFHAGIPGLINAVFNSHDLVVVILDNRTTAMTGHQPHPGTGRQFGGVSTPGMEIEPLVRGCGVEFVRTVDPYDLAGTRQTIKDALTFKGLAVVIAQRACPLLLRKEGNLEVCPRRIDQKRCSRCYTCVEKLSCPALYRSGDAVYVDETLCVGCGMCAQVCPKNAVEVLK